MKETEITKILVVDDTHATRYAVSRALKSAGYNVSEAATGHDALEMIALQPDLIILDIQLPDMTGYDIVRKIRSNPETESIPIIHASATNISNEDQALGLEGGADAYLLHPVDPLVLLATVKATLRVRKVENTLKQTIQQLNRERDLREQFVLSLTHDLRSPLSAAKMTAQLIARCLSDPTKLVTLSGRLLDAVNRTDQMIEDLLNANRIRAGEALHLQIAQFDLNEILQDAVENLIAVHGDRFDLKISGRINGYWDGAVLRRAFDNLGENAIKYGSPQNSVMISAEVVKDRLHLKVNNKGKALQESEIRSLFDPYNRTPEAILSGKKGWGLGLTLVKGFANSHGGNVTVTSDSKSGTTFLIDIPLDTRGIS